MSTLKGSRNNILAGTLFIVSVIATVVLVALLGGGLERLNKRAYVVAFDLETGVEGIDSGSVVKLGGRSIGYVSAVTFQPEGGQSIDEIHVEIAVSKDITLYEGTVALLEKPLLGATSTINFVTLGNGPAIAEDAPIPGRLAPPGFLAQAGYGEDQKTKVQTIIDRADEITKDVKESTSWFNDSIRPQADSIAADVKTVSSDIGEKWPAWSERVDSLFGDVDTVRDDVRAFLANLDGRTDQVRDALTSVQRYLDDNEQTIREGIAHAESVFEKSDAFMDTLNGELTEAAKGLLADGQDAINRGGKAVDEARAVIAEQRPNINASLANFRLTSDQLKDTLLEIRASPWRLLYRPDMRELEYELLYNSARSYARAVGEMRILTDRMEALLARPQSDLTDADREAIAGFVDDLARTRESYEKVEDAFLDQLLENRGSDE